MNRENEFGALSLMLRDCIVIGGFAVGADSHSKRVEKAEGENLSNQ